MSESLVSRFRLTLTLSMPQPASRALKTHYPGLPRGIL